MPAGPSPRRGAQQDVLLTIGKVIALLEPDFPDLSVSKIRFLEAEGLITPSRSGSGYRKYTDADVERIRYILAAQRDHFWPLKVIREALDALDRGEELPEVVAPQRAERLTAAELAAAADATPALVEDLSGVGLISPDATRRYGPEDRQILEAVAWLEEFGIEPRHLRPFRAAADREVGLIEQMLAPTAPGRERQARAVQMARRLLEIHAALVRKGLDEVR